MSAMRSTRFDTPSSRATPPLCPPQKGARENGGCPHQLLSAGWIGHRFQRRARDLGWSRVEAQRPNLRRAVVAHADRKDGRPARGWAVRLAEARVDGAERADVSAEQRRTHRATGAASAAAGEADTDG